MKKIKYLSLLLLFFISIFGVGSQVKANISVPEIQDIGNIETTNNQFRFYTTNSLRRMLPRLSPVTHGTKEPPGYQYGTITRKDGSIIKWKSSHFGNLILYDDGGEQFFVEKSNFWDLDLGLLTYSILSLAAFVVWLLFFLGKRYQSPNNLSFDPKSIRKDYWKIFLFRIAAFAMFAFLAYLTLQGPLQTIDDGAFLRSPGRFSDRGSDMIFADTDAKTFWLYVGPSIVVAFLPVLMGVFLLAFNPRSHIWARKPQPAERETD
ncbi:MAG: hypothetical protein ABIO36_01905 [Pyrinomonadaceae bacterium]